jgi:hypothetical protein
VTAETDLLPLPEAGMLHVGEPREWFTADQMHAYARANVAPLQAEIETLLAELDLRDSIIATHAADTREYQKRISQAEARADRLAEALREAKEKMLARVKWVACDCGCEGEKPADAVSIAWLRASALLSDQEEGR